LNTDVHGCLVDVCMWQVSDRPKWCGADMAQALGYLQLEDTGSNMQG